MEAHDRVVTSPPIYLDCNATTPLDPRARAAMLRFLDEDFGNPDSRTHTYGARAREGVERARQQVASVLDTHPANVIFTGGATEANNLAILGLAAHGEASGKRHIVSTAIEHKAVLEPLAELRRRGFSVELVPPEPGGFVDARRVLSAVRPETLLVTVMAANNETGIRQPIADIAAGLPAESGPYFHTDAAQAFGKDLEPLRHPRLDLMSVSAHKVYGPKGVGALVCRKREGRRPRLAPLAFGGGQERGLRPGTLPAFLIAGLGAAAEAALEEHTTRAVACTAFRGRLLEALAPLHPVIHGDPNRCQPHVVNLSVRGVTATAAAVALRDVCALALGSACTSARIEPSHVLTAMGLDDDALEGAFRLSFSHLTPDPDWSAMVTTLEALSRMQG